MKIQRANRRLSFATLAIGLVLSQSACLGLNGDGSVRGFLSTSYRIVKATDLIRKQIVEMNDAKPPVISTEKALSSLRLLRTVIMARMEVGNIFKQFVTTDANGHQTLNLTLKGKAEMQAAVSQMGGGLAGLQAGDLPSPEQIAINYQLIELRPIVDMFAAQVTKLKTNEKADLTTAQVVALVHIVNWSSVGDKLAVAELNSAIEGGELIACLQN